MIEDANLSSSHSIRVEIKNIKGGQFNLKAIIQGAKESVWQSENFELFLDFPKDYPRKPPKVKFSPPIFHPNVEADGSIFLFVWTCYRQGGLLVIPSQN